jgi:hypothetical protein
MILTPISLRLPKPCKTVYLTKEVVKLDNDNDAKTWSYKGFSWNIILRPEG